MKKAIFLLILLLPLMATAGFYDITNFPGGISTSADENDSRNKFPYPDSTRVYTYWDDFMQYYSGHWTITTTETGTVSATEALDTTFAGGALVLTNDNTTGDNDSLQLVGSAFLMASGKKTWLKTRISVGGTTANDAATYSNVLVGLVNDDTTPFSHSHGFVFKKDSGDTNIDFSSLEESSGTTASSLGVLATGTATDLGVYFDGKNLSYYINGSRVGYTADASFNDASYMTPTLYIANGADGSGIGYQRSLSIDYLLIGQER